MKKKEEILDQFYQMKLEKSVGALFSMEAQNGTSLSRQQVKDNFCPFPIQYEEALFEILEQIKYKFITDEEMKEKLELEKDGKEV